MADNNDANKNDSSKKSGLARKFGLAAGGLLLAGGLVVGGAAAINGVDSRHAEGIGADGQAAALKVTTIKPVFEKQTFDADGAHYWCWSAASIKCPIPVSEQDKPAYNTLKQQLKK